MSTADAFDDPIARPVRPTRVIADSVESAATVLREPKRRDETLLGGNGAGTGFVGAETALVETTRPVARTTDDGWPVDPPRAPLAPPAEVVPVPEATSPTPIGTVVVGTVVVGTVVDGTVVDEPEDWANDGSDGTAAVLEEEAIEVPVRRSRRPRVRKVNRVVRRIDPWTVFKIAFVLFILLYGVLVVAGVLLWDLANKTGTVDNIQGAVKELFALQTFVIDGKKLFRASWALGAIMAIAGTGMAVTLAVLFNLIADLVGGVRITVLEEEYVAREARSRRQRAREKA
jgi:Transmembrane domain of unknown function (DUF3566)